MTKWPKDAIEAYERERARVRHCYVALRSIALDQGKPDTNWRFIATGALKELAEWPSKMN